MPGGVVSFAPWLTRMAPLHSSGSAVVPHASASSFVKHASSAGLAPTALLQSICCFAAVRHSSLVAAMHLTSCAQTRSRYALHAAIAGAASRVPPHTIGVVPHVAVGSACMHADSLPSSLVQKIALN